MNADRPVIPLREIGRADVPLAGGKGANLGELLRARLPVPDGYVVTTRAYDRIAELRGVVALLERPPPDAEALRSAFTDTVLPSDLAEAITAAYAELGGGPVAVRSSATAEDLPEAAFAGQQDTFLNVIGSANVLDAVRRCWASLWNDRAIAYRERQAIAHGEAKLAVVVQRFVPAEIAGVMFTADPVTGQRHDVVIDASPGLGESVVSGAVTPDRYVLRRRRTGWAIVDRRAGRREVVIRARADGGTERVVGGHGPTMSDDALRLLARTGSRIQALFGAPQDIEWAWTAAGLSILQARPITALPVPVERLSGPRRFAAQLIAEMLPERPYPLDMTTWAPALWGSLMPIFALAGMRARPFDELFVEEDGVVLRHRGVMPFRPTPAVALTPVRLLRVARRHDPMRWKEDPLWIEAIASARATATLDVTAFAAPHLVSTMRGSTADLLPAIGEMRRRYFPKAILSMGVLRVLLALVGRGHLFGTLVFSDVDNETSDANAALEVLADRVRSDPDLARIFGEHAPADLPAALGGLPAGRAFLAELERVLDRHGHRETSLFIVLEPTWKDDPTIVLGILQALARTERPRRASRPAWEVARDDVLLHAVMRVGPLRSIFLRALHPARRMLEVREDTHFAAMLTRSLLRRCALELGRRLVEARALDAPEDIAHLRMDEIERLAATWPLSAEAGGDMLAVARRRKDRRRALGTAPLVDPRSLATSAPTADALVHGTPGSPGVADGPVRVIRGPSEFGSLRAGEVLVAPYTNPSWTPLFPRAAAVVVDSGSAASHAAIVAREYGIPAVMGTVDGTTRLRDGDRVRVDGGRGIVLAAAGRGERPG